MKTRTIDQMLAEHPCAEYDRVRLMEALARAVAAAAEEARDAMWTAMTEAEMWAKAAASEMTPVEVAKKAREEAREAVAMMEALADVTATAAEGARAAAWAETEAAEAGATREEEE